MAEVYEALKLGLRDYVRKNGFERVLVAVSGGIDSALVTLIAADALGPERVSCVVMPSPHSSDETQADARALVHAVGAELVEIPIATAMHVYEELLATSGDGPGTGLAAENLQARIRGNLMMALSNRFGWLVLTTGNKSEMSVGYATLYGDMAGGFAVIKDVPKTLVYELVRYRNSLSDTGLVPESVLERPPSAELRPGQLDQDSLPPYEMLDRILAAYVEEDRGRDEIVSDGLPAEVVDEVIAMVDRSEYKRRQAPPGIRITPKAFGRDRRLPITNRSRLGLATKSSSTRAHRNRHPDEGAGAPLVVAHLHVPDPGRAAPVPGACDRVHVALGDRAQEGGAVRLSHRGHPVTTDRQPGGGRADALGQHRVDTPVHDPEGLADVVAHLDPGADLVGLAVLVLDADQLPEPVASGRSFKLLPHAQEPSRAAGGRAFAWAAQHPGDLVQTGDLIAEHPDPVRFLTWLFRPTSRRCFSSYSSADRATTTSPRSSEWTKRRCGPVRAPRSPSWPASIPTATSP